MATLARVVTVRVEQTIACAPHEVLAMVMDRGTRLVRTLRLQFAPVVRWLLEPLFARRLEAEVREELRLAKQHLEQAHPPASS